MKSESRARTQPSCKATKGTMCSAYLEGLLDALEHLGRLRVVAVFVRMPFSREQAMLALDLLLLRAGPVRKLQ
eukprot:scaffold1186_cov399-Prasinococcus_capsulatus_cf.AAC.1